MTCDLSPALFCDEIPPLKKVVLSTKATIYSSKVAVSCEKGFMFPQNTNLKVIECIETIEFDRITAIWNDTIEACTGEVIPTILVTIIFIIITTIIICKIQTDYVY